MDAKIEPLIKLATYWKQNNQKITFRMETETTTALIEISKHLHTEIGNIGLVSVCFLDISTGFDTASHTYLLMKPGSSYLEGIHQVVQELASFIYFN